MDTHFDEKHLDEMIVALRDDLRKCPHDWATIAEHSGLSMLTVRAFAHRWVCSRNPTIQTLKLLSQAVRALHTERA